MTSPNSIVLADNLEHLRIVADGAANLVYIDPPFNTGKRQERRQLRTVRDDEGTGPGSRGTATGRSSLGGRAMPTRSTTSSRS